MQAESKGEFKREKPKRLASKLREVRTTLELSQGGFIKHLGLDTTIERDYVSKWERGILEPTLPQLLLIANAAGVYVDVLIDDSLDLPEKLPCKSKHSGIKATQNPAPKHSPNPKRD